MLSLYRRLQAGVGTCLLLQQRAPGMGHRPSREEEEKMGKEKIERLRRLSTAITSLRNARGPEGLGGPGNRMSCQNVISE